MTDVIMFESELLSTPSAVMNRYVAHFDEGARRFAKELALAAAELKKYDDAEVTAQAHKTPHLWSSTYFLNAVNCALVSTRLFLEGYLVPSGNQARHAVESLAFGVLLPFPRTGAFREWDRGHNVEYKALEWLMRSAEHCGTKKSNVEALRKQAKWFDHYSHPSRMAIATMANPDSDEGWELGATFSVRRLTQYRKEMKNRLSLTQLIRRTIAGTHRSLLQKGILTDRKLSSSRGVDL
jgi:hypothetical protein